MPRPLSGCVCFGSSGAGARVGVMDDTAAASCCSPLKEQSFAVGFNSVPDKTQEMVAALGTLWSVPCTPDLCSFPPEVRGQRPQGGSCNVAGTPARSPGGVSNHTEVRASPGSAALGPCGNRRVSTAGERGEHTQAELAGTRRGESDLRQGGREAD